MANLQGFNANEVDPNFAFEPIPPGKYLAAITESEQKDTQAGNGQYLQFTFQVLEGEYKGRLLWARLNLTNANATAVKIARAELSAICRAVGVLAPRDSAELHNIPLVINVAHKKRKDTAELTNVVTGYAKKDSAAAVAAAPAAASNGKAPWLR